jgi:hypothetical protein
LSQSQDFLRLGQQQFDLCPRQLHCDQQGTEKVPFVVKIVAPQRDDQIVQESQDTRKTAPSGDQWFPNLRVWFNEIGVGDKIATIATLIGFLQFIALSWTVWIMRRSARQQLRAYVSAVPDFIYSFDVKNSPKISFTMRNVGQTPAWDVSHRTEIFLCPNPLPSNYKFPPLTGAASAPTVLFPNVPFTGFKIASQPFSAIEIADINSGAVAIYVIGKVQYRDAFKKKRWSTFASFVGADASTLSKLTSLYVPRDLIITFNHAPIGNDAI